MASKPKTKTFSVKHRGQTHSGYYGVLGVYRVGARNEKEAEKIVKTVVGKHAKTVVFFQPRGEPIPHGEIIEVFKRY